jgi:hypothetical protein
MPKQKTTILAVLVLTIPCLISSVVVAQTATRVSPNFNQTADNALAAGKKELLDAGRAHKVSIQVDRMIYATAGNMTIVHAPITGIEKYKASDFEAGVPILLLIVRSTMKLTLPNGSYVVKAQYLPGANSGKVTFTDRKGTVSAERDLIVQPLEQLRVLFPGVYPDEPSPSPGIPNITSTHVWMYVNGVKKYYVDCAGVNGVLYFEVV